MSARAGITLGAVLLALGGVAWLASGLHGGAELEPGRVVYGDRSGPGCPPAARSGPEGKSEHRTRRLGLRFSVRTPLGYDPTRSHPLLVVFAPASFPRWMVERVAGFTGPLTTAGFVVAYADAARLSLRTIEELGSIPRQIAEGWCIDERRVVVTGHSDGGTVSEALVFRRLASIAPALVAASGAGVRAEDLGAEGCPAPTPIRIDHGSSDGLFPGYGEGVARWWATCNGCTEAAPSPLTGLEGCRAFQCPAAAPTIFCEHPGGHLTWPLDGASLLATWARVVEPRRATPGEGPRSG